MILFSILSSLLFAQEYTPHNGDIIFQTSQSSQSLAIQVATESPYSHVGIVYIQNDKAFVFEAVNTVRLTPLDDWVDRGKKDQITVMRTKRALSQKQLQAMLDIGKKYQGKHYDLAFQWSDDTIYCSELVWKVYQEGAHITLSQPNQFGDYNFTHPDVYPLVQQRWGTDVDLTETVVAPSDIRHSKKLKMIYSDFE